MGKITAKVEEYNQILNDYFYSKKSSANTQKSYTKEFIRFCIYTNKEIKDIIFDDCLRYIKKLEKDVKDKELSISTAEKVYSILYTIFKFISKNKKLYNLPFSFENYFDRIDKPAAPKDINYNDIISFGEIDRLMTYLKNKSLRDYAIFCLIFTSALTRTEISTLTWNQFVEDVKGNIGIEYNLPYGNKRFVAVTPDTWNILLEYRKQTLASDIEYVFKSKKRNNISINRINAIIKTACIEAGLKKNYTPTQIRQSAIAYALKNNIDFSCLIEQANWSDLRPIRRYDRVISTLDKGIGSYINFEIKKDKK